MSSTLARTRSPTPRANRISVVAGVSETRRRGSAARVTVSPSSSVKVIGNAGVGDALGLGLALVEGETLGGPWPAGPLKPGVAAVAHAAIRRPITARTVTRTAETRRPSTRFDRCRFEGG